MFGRKVAHKYLEEFAAKDGCSTGLFYPYDTPMKINKEYGFDTRETYCLNYTMAAWLYERLMYLLENGNEEHDGNEISFDYLFEVNGEVLDLKECMQLMIADCETIMHAEPYYDDWLKQKEKVINAQKHLFYILGETFHVLGW